MKWPLQPQKGLTMDDKWLASLSPRPQNFCQPRSLRFRTQPQLVRVHAVVVDDVTGDAKFFAQQLFVLAKNFRQNLIWKRRKTLFDVYNKQFIGLEPWFSGYRRRLMFQW